MAVNSGRSSPIHVGGVTTILTNGSGLVTTPSFDEACLRSVLRSVLAVNCRGGMIYSRI